MTLCFSLSAQEEKAMNFDYSLLANTKFTDSIPDLPIDLLNCYYKLVIRNLDFGIEESIFRNRTEYENRAIINEKYKMTDIHILSRNDTIIAIIGQMPYHRKKYYIADQQIHEFIDQHNSFYDTNTKLEDLVEDILRSDSYGYSCDMAPVIGGGLTHDGLYFKDIKNKDIFRSWLRSYNVELQSYGVDAMNYLYNHQPNFIITKLDEKTKIHDEILINHIKKRNSIIRTCDGCFGGIYRRVFF